MEMYVEKYPPRKLTVPIGTCPSCGLSIRLSGRVVIRRELTCPACNDELQVIEVNPVELDWLYDYDEDYDTYDDERR
jgi:hypothetical protein